MGISSSYILLPLHHFTPHPPDGSVNSALHPRHQVPGVVNGGLLGLDLGHYGLLRFSGGKTIVSLSKQPG